MRNGSAPVRSASLSTRRARTFWDTIFVALWRNIFKRGGAAAEAPSVGRPGARAYAVGDIHGRLDLLDSLLDRIEHDVAQREERENVIVFLGDFVDRGPESAGVIERLRTYRPSFAQTVFLAGNHEELFLRVLQGDARSLPQWLKFGGAECVESYGVAVGELHRLGRTDALELLRAKVPPEHVEFLEAMGDSYRFGDYLLVHAGIRPGVALEEQSQADLRWIREPFLSHGQEHGVVVVHGHTIVEEVEERGNRIGIDTGAYRSGVLTALVVEDDRRWYLTGEVPRMERATAA